MVGADQVFAVPPTADTPLRVAFDSALANDASVGQDEGDERVIEAAVPMRDGVHVAADIYLPRASVRPAPAVVFGTPYDESTKALSGVEAEIDQRAGYGVIVYDCRGRASPKASGRFSSMTPRTATTSSNGPLDGLGATAMSGSAA
jgi:hypothetical protein